MQYRLRPAAYVDVYLMSLISGDVLRRGGEEAPTAPLFDGKDEGGLVEGEWRVRGGW